MSETGQAVETRQPEIAGCMQGLEQTTGRVKEKLANLAKKIEPILRSPSPIGKENGSKRSLGAPLAQWLDSQQSALNAVEETLDDLLRRIELG